jgi:hypothetical protein
MDGPTPGMEDELRTNILNLIYKQRAPVQPEVDWTIGEIPLPILFPGQFMQKISVHRVVPIFVV